MSHHHTRHRLDHTRSLRHPAAPRPSFSRASPTVACAAVRCPASGVPVLGPTLIKALSSSPLFDPPLHTFDVPFNSGRIVIPRTELAHYILEHRARLGVLQQPHTHGEAAESSAVPAAVV